jgi:hypothetical protein
MATKSPLAIVKEKFGDKEKLVAAVEKFTGDDLWVSRTNQNKGLAHVSNAKLLRLHETFTAVEAKFGTRDKLIDAIVELHKRTKDAGYRQRLAAFPVPRLWDLYKSSARRAGTPGRSEGSGAKARAGVAVAARAAKAKAPDKAAQEKPAVKSKAAPKKKAAKE